MLRWLIAGCLTLLFLGCSTGGGEPVLDAKQVAERAAQAMDATDAHHFVIELSGRLTYVDPAGTLVLKRAEGDVVAPDKVRATVRTTTFGVASEFGVVGIGDQQWATNPLNNRWQPLPPELGSFNLRAMFDEQVGIASLLRTVSWTRESDTNRPYSLSSTVDGALLSPMTSGMITQGQVEVRLQIDAGSFRVSGATLVERDSSPDRPTTWQITLTQPEAAVEIVPPPIQ